MERLVTVTAPDVKGAHDAEMVMVGRRSYIVAEVNDVKAGESAAMHVAAGDASLVDVVTAISAAEVALETAIAVRNRVIEAYQEIMRMPI